MSVVVLSKVRWQVRKKMDETSLVRHAKVTRFDVTSSEYS